MCFVKINVFSSDSAHEILPTLVIPFWELGATPYSQSPHDKLDKLFKRAC